MRDFRILFAIRSLMKNKTYTLLNVVGLAIGLAVSIIIYLFLQSELSYDTSFPNHKNIYRIHSEFKLNEEKERLASSSMVLGPMLKEEFGYIENYTRLMHIDDNVLFRYGDKQIYEGGIAVADSNFFSVFNVPFRSGDPVKSLVAPRSMVVTRSFAERYVGKADPVGKIISTNNYDYTITGLIEDLPANTHHHFDAVISYYFEPISKEEQRKALWLSDAYTFLQLNDRAEPSRLENDFKGFYDKYMQPVGENFGGYYHISLAALEDIHFGEALQYDRASGDSTYLYAFGTIGILILILACINYVNMATARGLRRVKEAGLRKILGSSNNEIRLLIFAESFVLSLVSLFIAFVLVELVLELTSFNAVMEKDLALNFSKIPSLIWLPVLLALLVGLLSGWYPAINLSRVQGLAAINGGYRVGRKSAALRKFLVGFQFCISVAVVITALLMYRQMDYVKKKDLGFNKEDILLVPVSNDSLMASKIPEMQRQIEQTPYVRATSMAWSTPGGNLERMLLSLEPEEEDALQRDVVDIMHVGMDYFETMEIDLVEGRFFTEEDREEIKGVIVNHQLVEGMQWNAPIGKIIKWGFDESGNQLYEGRVVGVVDDFNSHSLHEPIEPTVIFLQDYEKGTMHIRVDSEHLQAALNDIENIWGRSETRNPFRFSFLNKDLMNLYEEEQRQSRLILFLTYLAIFISFLGLTGLASFTTGLRTREIGIRKVLGADVFQMVNLIFKDMLVLVVVSVLLAIPLAYFLIRGWLAGFAFSASLDPFIFTFSALVAVIMAYLIVTYHSVRVARSNPVDTLKYE